MMNLEVNGIRYEGFKSASTTKSMEAAAGSFTFTAAPNDSTGVFIKKGYPCRVLINEAPVITGFIEKIGGSWGHGNDVLQISGRDRTGDFIDSSYEENLEFKGPIQLKSIIERVIERNGLHGITVYDAVGNLKPFGNEVVSGGVGETCFQFCERYCRKRQVLLMGNGRGNLVITRASKEKIKTLLLNELGGKNNNIKSANFSDDDTQKFNKVLVKSQSNNSITDGSQVDVAGTPAHDKKIRTTRKLIMQAESACDLMTATDRAKWEVNIRRARGLTYDCVVYGHAAQADGRIWTPNMLVQVVDERAGINADMLIKSVIYSESDMNGSETTLSCVVPDAFTLQAEMDAKMVKANEVMTEFEGEEPQ